PPDALEFYHTYSDMLMLFLILSCPVDPRDLHSFPTRLSSDLARENGWVIEALAVFYGVTHDEKTLHEADRAASWVLAQRKRANRSEEHTSELQSRSDLVCRLLLEKKKTN